MGANLSTSDVLIICSELMCIPDAYNRNIYAQNITETVFEMYLNYTQSATEKLHDEIKQFVLYQSKIYYYIIMTYAFLTIDYILKNENPSDVNNKYDAEAYVRKIIGCGLEAINKPDLSKGQLPYRDFFIEDFDCFYRSVKRRIFNRETFDAYFNNDLFSVDVNVHEITEVLFKYLKKDHDISFGPKDRLNPFV